MLIGLYSKSETIISLSPEYFRFLVIYIKKNLVYFFVYIQYMSHALAFYVVQHNNISPLN